MDYNTEKYLLPDSDIVFCDIHLFTVLLSQLIMIDVAHKVESYLLYYMDTLQLHCIFSLVLTYDRSTWFKPQQKESRKSGLLVLYPSLWDKYVPQGP